MLISPLGHVLSQREELRFQSEITSDLNAEMEQLRKEKQKASTELALLKEQERQFALVGQAKNKQIRQLKEQVQNLKSQLADMIQRQNRETQSTREMVTRELESQTMHAAGLRKLLQLKEEELQRVRSLAQSVLDQRTEVRVNQLDGTTTADTQRLTNILCTMRRRNNSS